MLTLAGLREHGWIFGSVSALVLLIHVVLKEDYSQKRRALQNDSVTQRTHELANRWNGLEFTSSVGRELADVIFPDLDWASLELTEDQRSRLKVRLREVFDFLANPQFETYQRLKTDGLTSYLELSHSAKNLLRVGRVNQNGSPELVSTLKLLWNTMYSLQRSAVPPRIVGVSSERIRAASSATNSHRAILGGKVSNGLSVMQEALEPGFHYAGETNSVSSDSASGLFVHLSFFARSSVSTNAAPMYLSLYWSEPDQNWALSRLFADTLLNFHIMF